MPVQIIRPNGQKADENDMALAEFSAFDPNDPLVVKDILSKITLSEGSQAIQKVVYTGDSQKYDGTDEFFEATSPTDSDQHSIIFTNGKKPLVLSAEGAVVPEGHTLRQSASSGFLELIDASGMVADLDEEKYSLGRTADALYVVSPTNVAYKMVMPEAVTAAATELELDERFESVGIYNARGATITVAEGGVINIRS